MVLKPTYILFMIAMSFPSFMSPKFCEILIFPWNFYFLLFWPMFYHAYWKSAILRFGFNLLHNVIVTSYVGCLYLLWYVWKEETHSYTMNQLDISGRGVFSFQVHREGGKHPLVNHVTGKGLVRWGLTLIHLTPFWGFTLLKISIF